MEEMASYLRNLNSHCFDDSQWKIGAFLTNSFANKKKFRSRKKKIHFGLNQQPHCVLILNADRKSSVILEAHRSQIPIASLGDSTIPCESFKRITYPIPSRDTIEIVYFFCHSIIKTVILERNAMKVETQSIKMDSTLPTWTGRRGMTIPKKRCFSSAAGGSSDNYKVTFKRFILESQYKDFPGLRDHIDELLAFLEPGEILYMVHTFPRGFPMLGILSPQDIRNIIDHSHKQWKPPKKGND
jgi:hypothetical protein